MIEWTDELKKQFRRSIYIAIVFFVIAPLNYLIVTSFEKKEMISGGQYDIMFYILLIIAVLYPLVTPIIEKAQIKVFHEKKSKKVQPKISIKFLANARESTPEKLYLVSFLIKAAMAEASFIFGFLVYTISGDLTRMLCFYPIGIAWSIVYFPTKSRCEKFLKKVSSNELV